jgi:hypothetical protein
MSSPVVRTYLRYLAGVLTEVMYVLTLTAIAVVIAIVAVTLSR